jgi:SAM-dependent methyltransferase
MTGSGRKSFRLASGELSEITRRTLNHYDNVAVDFWEGTKDHDVVQNRQALLRNISATPPYKILDFGCGPGRDLIAFKTHGHVPVGLDGSLAFTEMAREKSGCEVLHQDFLTLNLAPHIFDGVFANASLFHIPEQELPRVLRELWTTLKPRGILFSSIPRGHNNAGWSGERYGCYYDQDTWRSYGIHAGFEELQFYYRPAGLPRAEQPWLATVWKKVRLETS